VVNLCACMCGVAQKVCEREIGIESESVNVSDREIS